MTDYTPTADDIRDGFSLNYARDYEEPNNSFYFEAVRIAEQAFSRWLEEHDRQVAEKAWDAGDFLGRALNPYRKVES